MTLKKYISIITIPVLLLSSCGSATQDDSSVKTESKAVKSEVAKKDFFTEDLKLIGRVSGYMETPISSMVGGAIKELKAEVGKKVKAGEILAVVDLNSTAYRASYMNAENAYMNTLNSYAATQESIKNDLESAKVALENAKTGRDNTYATTDKQLELTQTQLENVKKTKDNTLNTTAESLKNAELGAQNAKTALDNFERNSEASLSSLYNNISVSSQSVITTSDNSLNQVDILLGVTPKNANLNENYVKYLGAKDITTKTKAEQSYGDASKLLSAFKTMPSSTRADLDAKLEKGLELVNAEVSLFDNVVGMLNNTLSSYSFPQTQIDTISANMVKLQAGILQLQSQLNTLVNSAIVTKTQIDTQRLSLKNALSISQTQLASIKAGNTSQLDTISGNETLSQTQLESTMVSIKAARDASDNAVKIAQAQFESTQAKLESQRSQTKTQVDNAKGGKDLAKIQLDNTKIVAPFDGVITSRSVEVGSLVNPGTPAFSIGENNQVKVKVDVSGDNIVNFKLGQSVDVKKSGETFSGVVTLLSPAADPATKMFKAEISFGKKPESFSLGDYVDVYISKQKTSDRSIMVPYSSIISFGHGEYIVYVIGKDSKVKMREVTLGAKNSQFVEVLSGLNEGEKVVTSGALNLQDGDPVKDA